MAGLALGKHIPEGLPQQENLEGRLISTNASRFRLQSILDYRMEQVNQIQQKLAEAQQKHFKIQQRIQEADTLIAQAFSEQQYLTEEDRIDPVQCQNFPQYLWHLKQSRFEAFESLQKQAQVIQEIRETLKQAHIRQKSLEILKEKAAVAHRQELEKAENDFLSEMALMRRVR